MDENELLAIYKKVYDYVNERNIYEVRNIARAFGVNAPCENKKHDLIVKLLRIVTGVVPPDPPNNRGARVKAGAASDQSIVAIRKLVEECRAEAPYCTDPVPSIRMEFHDNTDAGREFGYTDKCYRGVLEIDGEGRGFLRSPYCRMREDDLFVSDKTIRSYFLRTGDFVSGYAGPGGELIQIETVNGKVPLFKDRRRFEDLAPLYPDSRLYLGRSNEIMRAADLLCPVGMGQRAVIYAPPGTGKTTFIYHAARSIASSGEAELVFVLLNQRPEEETEMRTAFPFATVATTSFDMPAAQNARIALLALERAKRIAEEGSNVVLFLDSLTALHRAFEASGMAGAEYLVKRFFASARKLEGNGSLTIIATAQMREEESYGEGANAMIRFSAELAARGIVPAIDFAQSFTKRAETLLPEEERVQAGALRAVALSGGTEAVLREMEKKGI